MNCTLHIFSNVCDCCELGDNDENAVELGNDKEQRTKATMRQCDSAKQRRSDSDSIENTEMYCTKYFMFSLYYYKQTLHCRINTHIENSNSIPLM